MSKSNPGLPAKRRRIRPILTAVLVLWTVAIGVGLGLVWRYENTPGVSAKAPVAWPTDTKIQLQPEGNTLILMAHPKCPCTKATIAELAEIMAHSQGRLRTVVLFLKPTGFPDDWAKTDLWGSAGNIPGVTVLTDQDGVEASRFGVATSGQAMLYDAAGHLLFSGGITGSRGHAGDNAGCSAIIALVNGNTADRSETEVFGCPLFDPNSECRNNNNENKKR